MKINRLEIIILAIYVAIFPAMLAGLLIIGLPVHADDEVSGSEEVIDLGELLVEEESLGNDEVVDRPTSFTVVIDPMEMIDRSITLADVLDTVQGITVRTMGGLGSLSTISIRGLGSENVLVILDGVPLNPSGGAVDLSDIPIDSLSKIEIIRGGDSSHSGGGASGGVIRLTSVDFADGSSDCARISIGSFLTGTASYTNRSVYDTFHIEMSGSGGEYNFLNDNGTSHDTNDDFIDIRENNEYGSFNARYSHLWDLNHNDDFRVSLDYNDSEKGIPGIITFPSPNASQHDMRSFIQITYSNDKFHYGELTATLSWLRQSRGFNDPLGETTGVPLTSSQVHMRVEPSLEWVGSGFGDEDVLTAGMSWTIESLENNSADSPNRSTLSARASDEWYPTSDLTLTGSIRSDIINGDPTVSPGVGARYSFDDNLSLRTNFGLDFRPPSFEELYRNEGFVIGNPDLTPERTLGFDIGLTESTDRFKVEAVYFNHQTKDLIDYILISGFRWKPYNIGRARSSGFEFSLDWLINSEWELKGNYTRTRAVDISGDPTYQGKLIVGQPTSQAFTELRWHENRWNAYANWEYRGPSPITPSGTRFLGSTEAFGIGLGYDLAPNSTLVLEIKNLAGENLTDIRGFPLPGQAWFLTWRGEW